MKLVVPRIDNSQLHNLLKRSKNCVDHQNKDRETISTHTYRNNVTEPNKIKEVIPQVYIECVSSLPQESRNFTTYTWRYSDCSLMKKPLNEFPNMKTILMNQNYRSTKNNLKLSDEIIAQNTDRIREENLFTFNITGIPISIRLQSSRVKMKQILLSQKYYSSSQVMENLAFEIFVY